MKTNAALAAKFAALAIFASPLLAVTATGLKSFEGIEEPKVKYMVATDTLVPDTFVNITDQGSNTVRMTLRNHPGQWWDGDRATKNKDRQRAEVKGLGPHQKVGDTFEYETTWRTNATFRGTDKFCHVFQLKATNGDNGAPLVVLSLHAGTSSASVRYWPGNSKSFIVARKFTWKPGEWQTVRIRIRTSKDNEATGAVMASVNGDKFQGAEGVSVFRPKATDYRPKWGFYRGIAKEMRDGDDYVEHKNVAAKKL